MDKLIFERGDENEDGLFDVVEPERITMDIPSGLDIYDFKLICRRMASAIGYNGQSIERAFGDETLSGKENIEQAGMREALNMDAVDKFFDTGSKK